MGLLEDLQAASTAEERHDLKVAAYMAIQNLVGMQFTPRAGVTITILDAGIEHRMLKFVFRVVVNGTVVMGRNHPSNPFYFKNPPVLVPDPAGDIVRTWTDQDGVQQTARYRQDLIAALRAVVIEALKDAIL